MNVEQRKGRTPGAPVLAGRREAQARQLHAHRPSWRARRQRTSRWQHTCAALTRRGARPRARSEWRARGAALLEAGGAKVAELDALIAGGDQFLWGTADLAAGVPELLGRLRAAKAWVGQARAPGRPPPALWTCLMRRPRGFPGVFPALQKR